MPEIMCTRNFLTVEEAAVQIEDETKRKLWTLRGRGEEAFGVFLCRLDEVSLDVTPKRRPVPVPVIPETAAAAAALAGVSRHLKKKKKKIKRGSLRLRERSGPQPLITPLPRQHSSRQQLQQINLSLTVHLD